MVQIKHWIQLVNLTPSCLNHSLLSRNSMGLTERLSPMAWEGLVVQPLPAPQTLSKGSRNIGLLSISRTNLRLCCCSMRTGPSHTALEAARPLPHHSTEADLGSWPTGSPSQVLPGPYLPAGPQWTAGSSPSRSLPVSLPMTFSFPLFQPPNAVATLGPCPLLGWLHLILTL